MRIESLTLTGFHCFGDKPTQLKLDDLTALIGANGCGKTAALLACTRLFGTSQSVRQIRQSDFHLEAGKMYDDFDELSLSIEAVIAFPELDLDPPEGDAIPECFNQMIVEVEQGSPYCRIRLSAKWLKTNLSEGEVEERIDWITSPKDAKTDEIKPMRPHERACIHTLYIPAIRDPVKQLRQASGTILSRLLRAANWSEDGKATIEESATSIADAFRGEQSVSMIEQECASLWQELQHFPDLANVQLRPIESKLNDIVRHLEVRFTDPEEQSALDIDRLSDGLRSLFYLTLIVGAFRLEQKLASTEEDEDDEEEDDEEPAFERDSLAPPALTLFALEEPENHLAAHYLGRVVHLLRSLSTDPCGQVILTSHSPAIMSRVEPTSVRHLRLAADRTTSVRSIKLPAKTSDAFKYVKESVLAYPELYFAKVVVLGEGDSEEIVLRRLAKVYGLEVDANSISVVPLGGRHVNHFWRLLHSLDIPHITLLDLDRERDGGGWGRIEYACKELESNGVPREKLYSTTKNGKTSVMPPSEVDEIHTWPVDDGKNMQAWIDSLEPRSVYFCSPLDLDFTMLSTFPEEYKATGIRGPQIPTKGTPGFDARIASALAATLKGNNSGGKTFSTEEKELFIWYSYLFLGNGKPTTHLLALSALEDKRLKTDCPKPLKSLFKDLASKLKEGS